MATGPLSAPNEPKVPGRDTFEGQVLFTSRWPSGDLGLEGKRIGLIGTGSSGVQTTPELAALAGHLYVFQRTPTFTWPSRNGPLDPEVQANWKRDYAEMRKLQRETFGGVTGSTGAIILQLPGDKPILESTEEERMAMLDERGFDASRAWSDVSSNPQANDMGADLYREMVRRTVNDPELAESLSPRGFPIGCKRPVIDSNYFETFNRDNVTLVDLRRGAIEKITPTGIQTAQGHFELDVIVFATGFDAMTGSLSRIDIRGRNGLALRDAWADGPRTYLGLQVAGFPNLFTVSGPGSPSVLANMVVCSEQHVEWIGGCLSYVREHGFSTVEATVESQDAWVDHVNAVSEGTMYTAPTCNSWYLGANIPGKPRVVLPYVGGLPAYIEKVDAIAAADYEGFAFS
jgi:cyclohexanone monooxygenase